MMPLFIFLRIVPNDVDKPFYKVYNKPTKRNSAFAKRIDRDFSP